MTVFDPRAAAVAYAEKDTDELVNIAYLDPNFLPEAKELALRELNKRGALKNKSAAIDRARREMAYRAQAVEQVTYENLEKGQRFSQKVREVMFIAGLWAFALVGPWILTRDGIMSANWMTLLIFAFWLFFVVDAIRKYRSTGRRTLISLVVVPAALFVIGWVIRIAT